MTVTSEHWLDQDGNPAGGITEGKGFTISWQNGPLGKIGTKERRRANGAFVEEVIEGVVGRLNFYQLNSDGRFACEENAEAIQYLNMALTHLHARTLRREQAGIEGTHQGS